MLRLDSGRARDRSPHQGHHGDSRDDRHWAVPLGGSSSSSRLQLVGISLLRPPPTKSLEQEKASTDQALQDLFASYANSLRAALHELFDDGHLQTDTQSLPSAEVRGHWLCKAEAYVQAASEAALQLGLAPGSATDKWPKPSWATFNQVADRLTVPPPPKAAPDHVPTAAQLGIAPGPSTASWTKPTRSPLC